MQMGSQIKKIYGDVNNNGQQILNNTRDQMNRPRIPFSNFFVTGYRRILPLEDISLYYVKPNSRNGTALRYIPVAVQGHVARPA